MFTSLNRHGAALIAGIVLALFAFVMVLAAHAGSRCVTLTAQEEAALAWKVAQMQANGNVDVNYTVDTYLSDRIKAQHLPELVKEKAADIPAKVRKAFEEATTTKQNQILTTLGLQ